MPESLSTPEVEQRRVDLNRAVLVCAWSVVVISLVTLVAWWAVAEKWMTFGLIVPAPRSAAVMFVLLGSALALRQMWPGRRWTERSVLVMAGIVLLAALSAAYGILLERPPRWAGWLDNSTVTIAGQTVGRLGLNGTLVFIASTFSFLVLSPSLERFVRLRHAAVVVAALITCPCFFNLISYTAGNPIFTGSQLFSLTLANSLNFALFNAGLLVSIAPSFWFRKWLFGVEDMAALPPLMRDHRKMWGVLGLWIAAILAVIVTYIRIQTNVQRDRTAGELQSMAGLKATEIVAWRAERFADAQVLARSPAVAAAMLTTADGSDRSKKLDELYRWLREFELAFHYKRVLALNAAMEPLAQQENLPAFFVPALRQQLRGPWDGPDVIELAPYVDGMGELRWDLLVVIRPAPGSVPVGAILLQTNIANSLWPILRSWPEDNKTGQFVLWHRKGNRLFSMGGLRPAPGSDDAAQRPFGQVRDLTQPNLLLARAVSGERGLVDGLDVRGIPIVGLGQWIPGSSWLLSCRVDATEVYAPVRRNAWEVVAISAAIFSVVGLTVARSWRERQRGLVHERVVAELEQKRATGRLGLVMRHAKEIIIVGDEKLRFVEVNQQAVDTYGWTREELLQMTVSDLRAPETQGSFVEATERLNSTEGAIYETIHQRKDGTKFPVEVSVRRVEIDGQPQMLAIVRDITERKRAEAQLRGSEEKFSKAFQANPSGIIISDLASGRFIEVNESYCRLMHYSPEELIGRTSTELGIWGDADQRRQVFQPLLDGGALRNLELQIVTRAGEAKTVLISADLIELNGQRCVVSLVEDITERKQAQKKLQELSSIIEQAPLSVIITDLNGVMEYVNPKWCAVTGYTREEALGRAVRTFRSEETPPEVYNDLWATITDSRVWTGQFYSLRKNGESYLESVVAAPLVGEDGRTTHYVTLKDDITAQKRFETETKAMLEKEREVSQMKSQFVSVASHEFRTPLAAAVGSLELLQRHAARLTEAKRLELIARIQTALGRLTTIMDDVLHLSRADSGRVKVKLMPVDLPRLVQDIIQQAEEGDRQQHRIAFQRTGGPDTVPTDTSLLTHILSNLVGNALRYSPAGTLVTVALDQTAEGLTFMVADEGIGIPEAEREKIFEPFVRGSNVGQIGGTGLGLNIVKRYVELLGGRIEVLPAERGTTFRVNLPFQPSPA